MRIRVVDVEQTGDPSPEHGLVEVAYHDLVPASSDLVGRPYDWVVVEGKAALCNPGCPIPPETAAVHHILDADVAGAPHWVGLMHGFVLGCRRDGVSHIAGHSISNELSWINVEWWGDAPLPSICTWKSALRIWPEAPLHSNMGLRYWRMPDGMDRQKALPAHRAGPDAYVTAFLLRDMLNVGAAIEELVEWTKLPGLLVKCRIGPEYRNGGAGTPWEEVDDGMLRWILDPARDFDENTLFTARHHLELRQRQRAEEEERRALNQQLRANGLEEVKDPQDASSRRSPADEIANPFVEPSTTNTELPL